MKPFGRTAAGVAAASMLLLGACGDDDDDATASDGDASETIDTTTEDSAAAGGTGADVQAYCDEIAAIGDEVPTPEQGEEILAVAPPEIRDDLETILGAIAADGEAAFSDPDVVASFGPVEAFEAENCEGGGDDAAAGTSNEIDPAAERVDVVADEYSFDFDAPSAGAVSFVLTNQGEEVHEMAFARFVGDTTLEAALAAEDPEADGLIESIGFEGPVSPGGEAVLSFEDLTPGRYAMVCFVPAPDGEPHAAKGMVSEFTVE